MYDNLVNYRKIITVSSFKKGEEEFFEDINLVYGSLNFHRKDNTMKLYGKDKSVAAQEMIDCIMRHIAAYAEKNFIKLNVYMSHFSNWIHLEHENPKNHITIYHFGKKRFQEFPELFEFINGLIEIPEDIDYSEREFESKESKEIIIEIPEKYLKQEV